MEDGIREDGIHITVSRKQRKGLDLGICSLLQGVPLVTYFLQSSMTSQIVPPAGDHAFKAQAYGEAISHLNIPPQFPRVHEHLAMQDTFKPSPVLLQYSKVQVQSLL